MLFRWFYTAILGNWYSLIDLCMHYSHFHTDYCPLLLLSISRMCSMLHHEEYLGTPMHTFHVFSKLNPTSLHPSVHPFLHLSFLFLLLPLSHTAGISTFAPEAITEYQFSEFRASVVGISCYGNESNLASCLLQGGEIVIDEDLICNSTRLAAVRCMGKPLL